ncbi:hypothetical protein N3K66_001113 [Trichothecium roseum]|uniref:Uncharacterized protein n=1 Tax=Trichothecium roseum TaxID=47278 RepID=A0ACC0VDU9_9HYPO|nr:hypothetical protein N3K66_001113 [Trichothecium roseum]
MANQYSLISAYCPSNTILLHPPPRETAQRDNHIIRLFSQTRVTVVTSSSMSREPEYRDQMWYSGIAKPPQLEPGQTWDMEVTYAEAGGASKRPRTKPRLRVYISQRDDGQHNGYYNEGEDGGGGGGGDGAFCGVDNEFLDGHLIFEPRHTEDCHAGTTHHVFRICGLVFTQAAAGSMWHLRCYLLDAPAPLDSALAMIFVLDGREEEGEGGRTARLVGKNKGGAAETWSGGPLVAIYGTESDGSDISLHLRHKN